jgi:hypothetical protein
MQKKNGPDAGRIPEVLPLLKSANIGCTEIPFKRKRPQEKPPEALAA